LTLAVFGNRPSFADFGEEIVRMERFFVVCQTVAL
jgi:hypothetical protein